MTMTAEPSQRAAVGGRETRQFHVQPVSLREDSDGEGMRLGGYASVTDVPYTVTDFLGEYTEVIRSGAFAKSLKERDDVRLLLNHEGLPLARTKSGTLDLREITDPKRDPQKQGQTGLWTEAELDPRSGLVNDVRIAMERGDLDEMSFAFQVTRQEWSPDYDQRDIQEVRLFDVSVVTYPANPATSVSLRETDLERLDDDAARELYERLGARLAPKTADGPDFRWLQMQAASRRLRNA